MRVIGRIGLLSGVAGAALSAAMPAMAQGNDAGEPASTADTAGDTNDDAIVVLGARLEESTPEELAHYGSRLEIVEGEDIDRGGYVDTASALQSLVPGLYVAPKAGAFDYIDVSLTGARSSEVLFLVDGVRISNRLYAGTTPLDTLPSSMIERIEVLKGGQGLYYGTQAVGGIVNVVTRAFTGETDGNLEIGYDTNEGYHINGYARGGTGNHYFVGFASHDEAEGFQPFRDEDYQPSQTDRKRGYDVTTMGGKYAFEPSDMFRLSASYQHTEAKLDFAAAEDRYLNRNDRNEEIASLKIDWSPAENLDVYVKGYWHDWDTTYLRLHNVLGPNGQPTGEIATIYDGEVWGYDDKGVNVLGEFQATDTVAIVAGYDFQTYGGFDEVFLIAPSRESVHAPFAQVKFDAGNLSLAAGVRHNMPSDGQKKTIWNASGRYGDDEGLYARGQVGTSFRLPTAYELYVVDPCCETGNPNLVAEESFNTEGGLGFVGGNFSAELIGFYRKVENLIGITYDLPEYPDGFLVNTPEAVKVWGGEAIVSAEFNDVVSVTVDYTHTDAREVGTDEQIVNIPKDLLKVILRAQEPSGRFGGSAALNYVGNVYENVGGGIGRVEHGNYAVLDISAWAFVDREQRHRIGLRLENAFDADYNTGISRVREDMNPDVSYPAGFRGTPMTLHATYSLSL